MASKKSSILVVAHSKQQNITPCLTTVLFLPLPFTSYHCSVSNFGTYTQHFKSTMFDLSKCFWSYNYRL